MIIKSLIKYGLHNISLKINRLCHIMLNIHIIEEKLNNEEDLFVYYNISISSIELIRYFMYIYCEIIVLNKIV